MCRTANGFDINHDPGVNGQTKDGRGNIAPATVVLPTIAMETMEDLIKEYGNEKSIDDEVKLAAFLTKLDSAIEDTKDELLERFEWIASQDSASAKFMYENGVMLGYVPQQGIRSALKHGTLAIGQLGLAEALQVLFGCDHTVKKGMDYAKRIEQLFKTRCAEYKEQYQLNFGVYYTPARLRAV